MKKMLFGPLSAAAMLLAGGLAGCGSQGAATADTASPAVQARAVEDSLMAHHDRAMGQTEQLFELKARLIAAKTPASAPVIAHMQAADQAMMTWMHHYQTPDSTAPAPQRLAYLQDQQHQLGAIEQQLRTSLDSAQATLRRAMSPPAPAAAVPPAK